MTESDLYGKWDSGAGYEGTPGPGVIFGPDGRCTMYGSTGDQLELRWELKDDKIYLTNENGHRSGGYEFTITRRQLPLGEFTVLETRGSLIPFGFDRFAKVE